MKILSICFFMLSILGLYAFKKKENNLHKTALIDVPSVYKKIYGASNITNDGTTIRITTNGVPDHKSPYFAVNNVKYEAYNGNNIAYAKNPNSIVTSNYIFNIPANPTVATNHAATPLGAIGVSLNGVPFYNQYAGPNQPLTNEINSFDQYNGHPQAMGAYHYHIEPLYLTRKYSRDVLLGFLMDGFPVYGPYENGKPISNTDLDVYHGHTHKTKDYPSGIYHYHITDAAPYLNGNGYYGTPGTVTR
jgi:hypothetical protein